MATTLAEMQQRSIDAMNVKLRAERAKEAKANDRKHVSPLGGQAVGVFGQGRWAVPLVAGPNSHTQQLKRGWRRTRG